jgi:hypothetical protein
MLRHAIPAVLQVTGTTEATKNYEQSHTYEGMRTAKVLAKVNKSQQLLAQLPIYTLL